MNLKHQHIARVDCWLFFIGTAILFVLGFSFSRANIIADSVDYYGILQWFTPAHEAPIVQNLHFAEQRSPGFSLAALLPYGFLTLFVEPFVQTEKISQTESGPRLPPLEALPDGSVVGRVEPTRPGPSVSDLMLIPSQPLLLREVPFKDFYVPLHDSWYQWKLVMALAITSFSFLFLGIAACASALRRQYPLLPGYSLVILIIFSSPFFIWNILATPLYATLTAFGASSLFVFFFMKGYDSNQLPDLMLAGACLGFLVLTRLETGVIAVVLVMALLFRGEFRKASLVVLGASWAMVAWIIYNLRCFGIPFHLGILRGDINRLAFDAGYIMESLVHPFSGVLIWTPLLVPGLFGLLWGCLVPLRILGYASLVFLVLCIIRVPVMYYHVGSGMMEIGGLPISVPSSTADMRALIRSDINRYVIVLAPFLVIGLREGIVSILIRKYAPASIE